MSFTLEDYFNAFQTLKQSKRFSAGAQSVYYAILAKFDSAHYPNTLSISLRDLKELAGLKSVASAHTCKNVLKNNRLIDFETKKGITVYRLLTEHFLDKKNPEDRQTPNDNRTAVGLLNLPVRARDSISTLSLEERAQQRETTHIAGARLTEVEELLRLWRESGGACLNVSLAAELESLLATHALDNIKVALKRAVRATNDTRYGISFDFLLLKLAEVEKKQTKKEGDKCEQPAKDPRDTWIFSND